MKIFQLFYLLTSFIYLFSNLSCDQAILSIHSVKINQDKKVQKLLFKMRSHVPHPSLIMYKTSIIHIISFI